MNKKLQYICCQPANTYYLWQIKVLLNNFIKMDIEPNSINIICSIEDDIIPNEWLILKEYYTEVKFYFYNDTREKNVYLPSIYFNLMKQHLKKYPELKDEVLFLHDADIVLTRPVDFTSMVDDNIWYMSNTNSYINYDYIQQKGNDIYEKMCDIIGIDKLIPKLFNSNSGGAQYIVKNTTYEFWDKVEKDSITLYNYFCEIEPNWNKDFYPIQKWTAGMWSLLWNAWYFGNETKVDKRLDFGWITNPYSDVKKYAILHNAGATCSCDGIFYKGDYVNKSPFNENLNIDKQKASYFYWMEICETAKNKF